jgi:two-component system, NarL family, response regulator DevR
MQVTIRIVVASPDREQRSLVEHQLVGLDSAHVVASAGDVTSTVLQATRTDAHVVIISMGSSEVLEKLCVQLQSLKPPPRTLLLNQYGNEEALVHAIESGVDGYVADSASIGPAIEALARGESVIPPAMLGPLLRRLIERQREAAAAAEQLVELTRREREVLSMLVDGLDQHAISRSLVVSPDTTRTHIQRVLRKLGVHSRREAVELVARTGLAERLERMVERSAS